MGAGMGARARLADRVDGAGGVHRGRRRPARAVAARRRGSPGGWCLNHLSGHSSFLIEEPGGCAHRHRLQRYDPRSGDAGCCYDEQCPSDALQRMGRARGQIHAEGLGPGGRGRQPSSGLPLMCASARSDQCARLGGTRYNGNSIFVFEIADLCIAHLGHLHHTLTPDAPRRARAIGRGDGAGRRHLHVEPGRK